MRYWAGLGQTKQDDIELYDVYIKNDPAQTWLWVGAFGTYYTEDDAGNWMLVKPDGSKYWGSADGGYCDSTGYCSGNWKT
jgi:hypothetical protein